MLIVLAASLTVNGRSVSGVSAGSSASVVRPSFAAGSGDAEASAVGSAEDSGVAVASGVAAGVASGVAEDSGDAEASGVSELSGSEVSGSEVSGSGVSGAGVPAGAGVPSSVVVSTVEVSLESTGASSAKTVVPKENSRRTAKNAASAFESFCVFI